jgi:hypothetical protein
MGVVVAAVAVFCVAATAAGFVAEDEDEDDVKDDESFISFAVTEST